MPFYEESASISRYGASTMFLMQIDKRRRGGRDVQKLTAQDSLGQGRRVTRRPCRFMGGELV